MILYCTSSRPTVSEKGRVLPCPNRVCRQVGKTYPHLCFSTEPLSGMGEFVFSLDVPEPEVAEYEYGDGFRVEKQARFFALPHALVASHTLTRESYESITGNPWNEWTITVLDRRPTRDILGRWALVWLSRDGVARARVDHKSEDGRLLTIQVTATSDFDPEQDYVVVEHHEESTKDFGKVKETWFLETCAGTTPQWVIFPKLWENWVWDREVKDSALSFIMHAVPSVRRDVEFAHSRDSKHNKSRAWRQVADDIGRVLSRDQHRPVDLGRLAGHSWTAVEAMPLRIAERLGNHIRDRWVPPVPKPEFEHPNDSGRVLLANLYGAYPKHGPGVDHDPQDRPYQKIEGELGGDNPPFVGSREVSAALSAATASL